MKFKNTIPAIILTALVMTGCDKAIELKSQLIDTSDKTCSSKIAVDLIKDIINDGVESRAKDENKGLNEDSRLDLAKVRALTAEVKYGLHDIITTKNDPSSSKKFCEANLEIGIPDSTISNANQARKTVEKLSIKAIVEDADFKVNLNKFSKKIAYSVQPTDDGKKIYVNLENAAQFQTLVSEAVLWASLNIKMADLQASPVRAAVTSPAVALPSAPAHIPTQVTTPPSVAVPTTDSSVSSGEITSISESTSQYATLEKEINVVWNSLPKELRDENRELQRKFNTEKETVCFKEATAAGIGERFEIARNKCWSRFYTQRIPQLKGLI